MQLLFQYVQSHASSSVLSVFIICPAHPPSTPPPPSSSTITDMEQDLSSVKTDLGVEVNIIVYTKMVNELGGGGVDGGYREEGVSITHSDVRGKSRVCVFVA